MRVKNLVSWAGTDFLYAPGELIELPDAVALARMEAGLVEKIVVSTKPDTRPEPKPEPIKIEAKNEAGELKTKSDTKKAE